MAIDPNLLANLLMTSFLFPYVKQGAEKIASAVTEKFSDNAAAQIVDLGSKVWNKVKSVFSSTEDTATLSQFEKYPDEAKALIEKVLAEKLKENPQLADEFNQLVNKPIEGQHESSSQIMINAGIAGVFNAPSSTFSGSGGQYAGIIIDNGDKKSDDKK